VSIVLHTRVKLTCVVMQLVSIVLHTRVQLTCVVMQLGLYTLYRVAFNCADIFLHVLVRRIIGEYQI